MIYIDEPRSYPGKGVFSHMVGGTIKELHDFAGKVGINRCWFSNKKGKCQPHYDVRKADFDKCLAGGAVLIERRFIAEFLKQNYSNQIIQFNP